MNITHTIRRTGGIHQASMSGLGSVVADPVINVRWSDDAETQLRVTASGAVAWHRGKQYQLRHVAGDIEAVASHWIAAIGNRLEAKRLQDRVRGGIPRDQVAERLQRWNEQRAHA